MEGQSKVVYRGHVKEKFGESIRPKRRARIRFPRLEDPTAKALVLSARRRDEGRAAGRKAEKTEVGLVRAEFNGLRARSVGSNDRAGRRSRSATRATRLASVFFRRNRLSLAPGRPERTGRALLPPRNGRCRTAIRASPRIREPLSLPVSRRASPRIFFLAAKKDRKKRETDACRLGHAR